MESLLLCTWGPWGKKSLWEKQNHSPRSRKEKQLTRRPCGPCAPSAGYRYSISSAQPVLVCILVCIFYAHSVHIYVYVYAYVQMCVLPLHIFYVHIHTFLFFLYTHTLCVYRTHIFHPVASLGRKKMHYKHEEEVERKTKTGQGLRTHGIIVPLKPSGLMFSPL